MDCRYSNYWWLHTKFSAFYTFKKLANSESISEYARMKIDRAKTVLIKKDLKSFPVVAILGARQVGKTTLAKEIKSQYGGKSVYIDLEYPPDFNKLSEPELFFKENEDKLIIIDEIQLKPELFPILRSVVDINRKSGRFLILGSASPELINKSSQTLAGRIVYEELLPFSIYEVGDKNIDKLWIRGGFPDSYLASNDNLSFKWLSSFVKTFLERDLGMLGFRSSPAKMRQVWTMIAHCHSSVVNYSTLSNALDVTDKTVKHWINVLSDTYMLRVLKPWSGNVGKRLVKSPKIYLTDSGILHLLLGIETKDSLITNPILGASWEGFVLEQIFAAAPERSDFSFYRSSNGDEIDLIVSTPNGKIFAFEIKRSLNPVAAKGFYNALAVVKPTFAYVVYSGNEKYSINKNLTALPISKIPEIFNNG